VKVRVWVGTSSIAGKGLFAAQTIKKGTRIIQYIGQRISKAETAERLDQGNQYIFTFNDHYDIDGKTLKNKARYINHSCDPNCDILLTQRTIWIVAKRDIKEGEELSYNYGFTAKQYRCQCGAKNCCGYILGEEYKQDSTSAHTRRHPLVKIRVRVGTSGIAGQGLFAGQDIKQGTKIIRYIGEKITHEESERRLTAGNVYIFGLDERSAIDGSTPKNTARYINHSYDPNCHTE